MISMCNRKDGPDRSAYLLNGLSTVVGVVFPEDGERGDNGCGAFWIAVFYHDVT